MKIGYSHRKPHFSVLRNFNLSPGGEVRVECMFRISRMLWLHKKKISRNVIIFMRHNPEKSPEQNPNEMSYYSPSLVGFGRACAPVRCAHPSFWVHCQDKGELRAPPPRPSQLRCSPKNKKYSGNKMLPFCPELGPPGAYVFPLG
jgi:hypothetical protein